MTTNRRISIRLRSVLVGVFILVAYSMLASTLTDLPAVILIADVISGIAVIGIAVLMFPLFQSQSPVLPLSYLVLKWAEGLLMITAGILFLSPSSQGLRESIYGGVHYYVFIVSGGLFYVLLYIGRLVPRYISVWGMVSIGILAISAIFGLLSIELAILEYAAILIITNEVYLAVWLFVKDLKVGDSS